MSRRRLTEPREEMGQKEKEVEDGEGSGQGLPRGGHMGGMFKEREPLALLKSHKHIGYGAGEKPAF